MDCCPCSDAAISLRSTPWLLRTSELLRAEAEFVTGEAENWLASRCPPFERLHLALQRRVLHLQLLKSGILPDFQLIESLRMSESQWISIGEAQLCRRGPDGTLEVKRGGTQTFSVAEHRISLAAQGSVEFEGVQCKWSIRQGSTLPQASPLREVFDRARVGNEAILRHWRPGDRFQPIGMAKPVKLQDLFINLKVPREQRYQVALAATAEGEIFWVEGLRICEKFKVTVGTQTLLFWHWKRI